MRTIIAGSRNVEFHRACELVAESLDNCGFADKITHIIHGDARGIDRSAKHVCADKYHVIDMPAEWGKFGKAAGYMRNDDMAKNADALICVWDGKSPGSKNMIDIAKKRGLLVYVHYI